jgi:hypothetical protein
VKLKKILKKGKYSAEGAGAAGAIFLHSFWLKQCHG